MERVNLKTGKRTTIEAIRAAHPNMSIPDGADLVDIGYAEIEATQLPLPGPGEVAEQDDPEEYAPGRWRAAWRLVPKSADLRRCEIATRLAEIDLASVRPLRAVAAGAASAYDTAKLAALDAEAAGLRAELVALPKTQA